MAYQSWSVSFGEQPSAAKWNILGTNDATFDALIGSGTAWTSWTPTWANLTVGNGTHLSAYQQLGKLVYFRVGFTLGTTSSVGTGPTFTLPVTAKSGVFIADQPIGHCSYSGSGTYAGRIRYSSTTVATVVLFNSSSTYASDNNVTATAPFAWASTYTIAGTGFYEAA